MQFVQMLVNTFSVPMLVVIIVGGYIALSLLITLAIHKLRVNIKDKSTDHFRQVFGVVATTLGIALSFLVVVVWQRYWEVQHNVVQEANSARLLDRQSDMANPAAAENIRAELSEYVNTVITDEWPKLAQGEESDKARKELDDLWTTVMAMPNESTNEVESRSKLIDTLSVMNDTHRTRIFDSRNTMPGYFWVILFTYSILAIVIVSLFHQSLQAKIVSTIILSFSVALMFLLISLIDYPFSGETKITPAALEYVRDILR